MARDGENLGKFDAKVDVDVFLEHSTTNLEITKDNPNDIPERDIEVVLLDDSPKETRSKHKSRVPKNHLISNVIALSNESWTTALQEELN
ncbi:hypothetical protein AAG906_040742 [Vitis piasezkii]